MTPAAPTLQHLMGCSEEEFVSHLGSVFEHAPWVARAVARQRPFADAAALHSAMIGQLRALPEVLLVELLRGHPELAGSQARAGTMTADSQAEQGGLALGALGDDSAAQWDALNAQYTERFGFPFILCIRRHTRASALRVFERRLANDRATELCNALGEIARISRLRLAARIGDHGFDDVSGSLRVHVIDASNRAPMSAKPGPSNAPESGRAASGLRLELFEASGEGRQRIVSTTLDGKEAVLIDAQPLRIGRYELRLHVGAYFSVPREESDSSGAEFGDAFLDVVPLVFGIDAPEGHLTLYVEISPSSYAFCRAS